MSQKERRDIVDIAKRVDHIALGRDLANAADAVPGAGPEVAQAAEELSTPRAGRRRTLRAP